MSREKGLIYVHEVKKLLEAIGHQVEGPGYMIIYIPLNPGAYKLGINRATKPIQVHKDYFGVADLISYFEGKLILHQVTDLSNKSIHVKAIQERGLSAWVWCRFNEGRRIGYRIFFVDLLVEEGEIIWRG